MTREPGHCDRCHRPTSETIMSKFDTAVICLACEEREREHPDFAKACAAEEAAVRSGDFNFPGIGLPPDLA